jgi:hypothetical protein
LVLEAMPSDWRGFILAVKNEAVKKMRRSRRRLPGKSD